MSDAAWDALRPILRAQALTEHRALYILCRKRHRIAEVTRTTGGLVLHGKGRIVRYEDGSAVPQSARLRVTDIAVFVRPNLLPLPISVQCRCGIALIPADWIIAQIAAGWRSVIWPP